MVSRTFAAAPLIGILVLAGVATAFAQRRRFGDDPVPFAAARTTVP